MYHSNSLLLIRQVSRLRRPKMTFEPNETFRNPIQIGLLVDDLEKVMQNLEEIFGIGPFRIVDFPPPGYEDVMPNIKGKTPTSAQSSVSSTWVTSNSRSSNPSPGTIYGADYI